MKVLITGSAGFIGSNVAMRLLEGGHDVVGIDNMSPYYDVRLKEARNQKLTAYPNFVDERVDLENANEVARIFKEHGPDRVINLAAQAGVRYSLENPRSYVDTNVVGFLNILEGCRSIGVEHLVYASSSSVYGTNTAMPFSEHQNTTHPVSLYAATKRSNELMAHTYSHLFGIPTTGLRFFTVYGPWGRPDMALFMFAKGIIEGTPINIFNNGDMDRDFTYIDDIVDGVMRLLDCIPVINEDFSSDDPDPATSGSAPFRVYNIGNNKPVRLMHYVETLEKELGREAIKNMLPMQPGDVKATWADTSELMERTGYKPSTSVEEGVAKFVAWYKEFYGIS